MKSRTIVVVAALAAGFAGRAAAQMPLSSGEEHHFIRIGFGGGASVPTAHAADALKTGVNGEGFILVDLRILPPLRFNLGYQRFNYKDVITGATGSGQNSILSGVGGLNLPLFSLGPIRPYLTAGAGAFDLKDSFTGVTPPATTAAAASAIHFGIDGGGGIQLKLGRLEAFVEGRVQNVYTDQGVINAKTIQAIPVSFGIIY